METESDARHLNLDFCWFQTTSQSKNNDFITAAQRLGNARPAIWQQNYILNLAALKCGDNREGDTDQRLPRGSSCAAAKFSHLQLFLWSCILNVHIAEHTAQLLSLTCIYADSDHPAAIRVILAAVPAVGCDVWFWCLPTEKRAKTTTLSRFMLFRCLTVNRSFYGNHLETLLILTQVIFTQTQHLKCVSLFYR